MNMKICAALIFLACLTLPEMSWGHAFPDHSDPRVGSTVTGSPSSVRIWFDGDLEPAFSTIVVRDINNREMDKRDGHVDVSDPTLLEVRLPKLPPGTYQVFWNVVARDGHRTSGRYEFTVK